MKLSKRLCTLVIGLVLCTSRSDAYYTTRGQNIVSRKTGETAITRRVYVGNPQTGPPQAVRTGH